MFQRNPSQGLSHQLKMLLVEDDANDVELLRRAFSGVGSLDLDVAFNGREAVNRIQAKTVDDCWPDLILCDLNMPVMNGLEFIKWLKNESPCPRMPLVVLTSSAVETDLTQAYDLGAAAYLVKPSGHAELQTMAKALADFWRLVHTAAPLRRRN